MPPTDSPVRPKVAIKNNSGGTTYHTYDSFDVASADINISSVNVSVGLGQAGYFTILIEDSGEALNANVGNGSKIVIQAAKTQGALANLLTGYVRHKTVLRDETNTLGYLLMGYGSQIRSTERVLNYWRFGDRDSFGSADPASDTDMRASTLFLDAIEDEDVYPIGGPLESWTTTGVDTISEQLPSIREPFVEMNHIFNQLAEGTGCIWGVDASEDAFFRYPTGMHSGITITDNPQTTDGVNYAYFVGKWNYEDSIEKTDGFANRLYGRGGTQLHVDQSQTTDAGTANTLLDTDRAQAFTPTAHNLDAIQLKLSRVGTLADDIEGEVRLDNSNDPTGDIVASFKVWKDRIGTSATDVTVTLQTHGKSIQVDKKHWIVLKENGADVSNRARWHHDNGSDGNSGSRSPGGSGAWTVVSNGVDYCFATLCSRRILNEASSAESITKYGVIEAVIDAPWIIEGRTMDRYLTNILQFSAKQKRIYDIPKVKAPDALFVPGKMVNVIDSKAGLMTQAELLQATYNFDAYKQGIGTSYVTGLKLVTHVV